MSLTPTQSISAPCAWAARNTLRPMRPKPLMPAFNAMQCVLSLRSRWAKAAARGGGESINGHPPRAGIRGRFRQPLRLARGLAHVAVTHVDEVPAALLVQPRQVLGDHHRPVPSAGAPDPDRQVRLCLAHVRREHAIEEPKPP